MKCPAANQILEKYIVCSIMVCPYIKQSTSKIDFEGDGYQSICLSGGNIPNDFDQEGLVKAITDQLEVMYK